ncbi:MAG: 1-deoxy-D-xylulose-5-phosphate reductoisomerase [Planctomycetota bacterium]
MSEQAPWRTRPLCLLGATGSVGSAALDVCRRLQIPVHTVTAHRQAAALAQVAIGSGARRAVIADATLLPDLRHALAGTDISACAGPAALCEAAADDATRTVLTAVVGAAGLPPTLAAITAGKRVCIANKEPLVMAGALLMTAARRHKADIVPVDSEHAALFQCLDGRQDGVEKLWLTGSGGPLRERQDLEQVSVTEALTHPTWNMGPKITIDSATLMNKALELIEAHHLFAMPPERLGVVIHPQSQVHALVQYADGSLLAQFARPDMRLPVQYAFTWPHCRPSTVQALDPTRLGQLQFLPPDRQRFPSLDLAEAALSRGGLAPVALNAANEVAVQAFLDGRLSLTGIFGLLERALTLAVEGPAPDLDSILACDHEIRRRCREWLQP